jgi:hypothetical protein
MSFSNSSLLVSSGVTATKLKKNPIKSTVTMDKSSLVLRHHQLEIEKSQQALALTSLVLIAITFSPIACLLAPATENSDGAKGFLVDFGYGGLHIFWKALDITGVACWLYCFPLEFYGNRRGL